MFAERSMTRQEFITEYGYEPSKNAEMVQFHGSQRRTYPARAYRARPDPASKMEVEWLEKLYSL